MERAWPLASESHKFKSWPCLLLLVKFDQIKILSLISFLKEIIYLFLAALGLHCCMRAFSSCGEQGATLRCGARASPRGGFFCCGAWALRTWASVVVARRLSSCGLRALEHRLSSCGTWA